jgi:hypothetical protein
MLAVTMAHDVLLCAACKASLQSAGSQWNHKGLIKQFVLACFSESAKVGQQAVAAAGLVILTTWLLLRQDVGLCAGVGQDNWGSWGACCVASTHAFCPSAGAAPGCWPH